MNLEFTATEIPKDVSPVTDPGNTGDYDPDYPGSTPDAPYGFKDNGEPYKRRPNAGGTRKTKSGGGSNNAANAHAAASMLARMNGFLGIGLASFGMPLSAAELAKANETFESMAYEALLSDPALCKKILSAGATSGKAGLILAYGMLTVSIAPAAMGELKDKRALRAAQEEYNEQEPA